MKYILCILTSIRSLVLIALFPLFRMLLIVLPLLHKLHHFCQVFSLFMYKHSKIDNSRSAMWNSDSDDNQFSSNKRYEYYANSNNSNTSYSNSSSINDNFNRQLTDPSYSYLSYNIYHNTYYENY